MSSMRSRLELKPLEDRTVPSAVTFEQAVSAAQLANDTPLVLQNYTAQMLSLKNVEDTKLQITIFLPQIVEANRAAYDLLATYLAQLEREIAENPATSPQLSPLLGGVGFAQFQAFENIEYSIVFGALTAGLTFPDPDAPIQPPLDPDGPIDPDVPPVPPVPPVVPPPPIDPTDNSGLVDSMPDLNAPEWQTLPSGVQFWDTVVGEGPEVLAGDVIEVFYTGWLAENGNEFDSNRESENPAVFPLNGLILGWQLAVPGMNVGGIRRLIIPSALGYGEAGVPPGIPPNADLVFEIKTVGIID